MGGVMSPFGAGAFMALGALDEGSRGRVLLSYPFSTRSLGRGTRRPCYISKPCWNRIDKLGHWPVSRFSWKFTSIAPPRPGVDYE